MQTEPVNVLPDYNFYKQIEYYTYGTYSWAF